MPAKDKKSTKKRSALRHGKKLEAQKSLDIPMTRPVDAASPK
jgi:hypothetical protein